MSIQKYDVEMLLDRIKTIVAAGINSKITAINSEKNDGLSVSAIDSNAYALQSMNGATINYDPFVFYGVQDINSEGDHHSYTVQHVEVIVAVVKADPGEDVDIAKRMFRYQRALKETIEESFEETQGSVKLSIQSLVPIEFQLMNSSQMHRAIGVLIKAELG